MIARDNHPPERTKVQNLGPVISKVGLEKHGISNYAVAYWNLTPADLYEHAIVNLEAELSERITNRWDIVNNAILRNSVRWLAPGLTKTITTKSVAVLHKRIYDGVYKASRSGITRGITKKLTQAVVSSITHALTRNPRSDYYCYHCKTAKVYCKYCELAMVQQAHVGFYANYYSSYFGDYYGKMYDGAIGQHFAAKSSKVHWTKKRFL